MHGGLFTFLLLPFLAVPTQAQGLFDVPKPTDVAGWEVEAEAPSVRPGERAALLLKAVLEEGWRMYAIGTAAGKPLSVVFTPTEFLSPDSEIEQEDVTPGYDANFDTTVTYFTPESRLRVHVDVAPATPAGTHPLPGSLEFMVCNDRVCLPPTRVPLEAEIVVAP